MRVGWHLSGHADRGGPSPRPTEPVHAGDGAPKGSRDRREHVYLGTVVTRRTDVRSRFRRSMALPMNLGTGVARRPEVRAGSGGRGSTRMD